MRTTFKKRKDEIVKSKSKLKSKSKEEAKPTFPLANPDLQISLSPLPLVSHSLNVPMLPGFVPDPGVRQRVPVFEDSQGILQKNSCLMSTLKSMQVPHFCNHNSDLRNIPDPLSDICQSKLDHNHSRVSQTHLGLLNCTAKLLGPCSILIQSAVQRSRAVFVPVTPPLVLCPCLRDKQMCLPTSES